MNEITVTREQNIVDLCLQVYGTLERLYMFATDNNRDIDSDVQKGEVLKYDQSLAVTEIVNKINEESYIINNN